MGETSPMSTVSSATSGNSFADPHVALDSILEVCD